MNGVMWREGGKKEEEYVKRNVEEEVSEW